MKCKICIGKEEREIKVFRKSIQIVKNAKSGTTIKGFFFVEAGKRYLLHNLPECGGCFFPVGRMVRFKPIFYPNCLMVSINMEIEFLLGAASSQVSISEIFNSCRRSRSIRKSFSI